MKEAITGLLTGMALGALLIGLLVLVLSVQSVVGNGENQLPQESSTEKDSTNNMIESETESITESESETESEPGNESEVGTESETGTESEVGTESETGTESESEAETAPETESEAESEFESVTEEKPTELIPDSEGEGGAVVEPDEHPYYIKVNRSQNCITVYGKDENGEYTIPVKAMVC